MILITKIFVIFPLLLHSSTTTSTTSTSTTTKALKDFPLLAAKLSEQEQEQPSQGHATSAALVIRPIRSHINQYIADIHTRSVPSNSGIKKNSQTFTQF